MVPFLSFAVFMRVPGKTTYFFALPIKIPFTFSAIIIFGFKIEANSMKSKNKVWRGIRHGTTGIRIGFMLLFRSL